MTPMEVLKRLIGIRSPPEKVPLPPDLQRFERSRHQLHKTATKLEKQAKSFGQLLTDMADSAEAHRQGRPVKRAAKGTKNGARRK